MVSLRWNISRPTAPVPRDDGINRALSVVLASTHYRFAEESASAFSGERAPKEHGENVPARSPKHGAFCGYHERHTLRTQLLIFCTFTTRAEGDPGCGYNFRSFPHGYGQRQSSQRTTKQTLRERAATLRLHPLQQTTHLLPFSPLQADSLYRPRHSPSSIMVPRLRHSPTLRTCIRGNTPKRPQQRPHLFPTSCRPANSMFRQLSDGWVDEQGRNEYGLDPGSRQPFIN